MNLTDQLAQALENVLASAHPSSVEHPRMHAAWQTGIKAIKAYRASKEGEKVEYRALVWNVDQFQKGDEFQVDGEWRPSPEKNYGLTYCGAYLPHRRPIRAT